jgi:predicted amidophosphoribosyltransferase
MVFCSKCGEELPEKAYFCPKCGVRTEKGKEVKVPFPWEGIFSEVGDELDKAFTVAGKEIKKAFETAKKEIKKATRPEPIKCPNCGETTSVNASFCSKCGKELR